MYVVYVLTVLCGNEGKHSDMRLEDLPHRNRAGRVG